MVETKTVDQMFQEIHEVLTKAIADLKSLDNKKECLHKGETGSHCCSSGTNDDFMICGACGEHCSEVCFECEEVL